MNPASPWRPPPPPAGDRADTVPTVLKLGTAQTLAWGSTYYLPAVLAAPMARELQLPVPMVFAAFSVALVISGLLGPWAGRRIDRLGGRPMLMASNGVFALGLVLLAAAQGPLGLFLAWAVLGLGFGCGLYEAAFATLVRLYGVQARNAITGVTLLAGLASTVGWPLSTLLELQFGWRGACLGWAALHLLLGLPLNAWLPSAARAARGLAAAAGPLATEPQAPPLARPRLTEAVLAFVFAATAFISTAMASHLPALLQAAGCTLAAAVAAGALVGPSQVAGRLLEFGALRRAHPLWSARAALLGHPVAVAVLLVGGAAAAWPFAVLHGLGNGILTITKGTLPLALFGARGYGERQGRLMRPARVAGALAPVAFGLALDHLGAASLWLSGGLGLLAVLALMSLHAIAAPAAPAAAAQAQDVPDDGA